MNIILRRRKLGATSCNAIAALLANVSVARNDRFPDQSSGQFDHPGYGFVFRWGCTSTVTAEVVVNTATAIHWCTDKRQSRLDMQAAGVSVPETWPADYVFSNESPFGGGAVLGNDRFVLRPRQHSQGRNLWTGTDDEILAAIRTHNVYDGYVSRLINKVAEYRVYVIQGRVACVASKTPADPSAVAWNVAQGGRFDNVKWGQWPMAAIKEALAAATVSRLDFCGVDVMMDADGNAYVLEVNSAPSLTSAYRQTCFAKCFNYIINNGKDQLAVANVNNWKDVIHPAIWEA